MALQAVTHDKETFCSSCGARVRPEDAFCPYCTEQFSGIVEADLCGSCKAVVTIDKTRCGRCGTAFTTVKSGKTLTEDEYLERMLRWKGSVPRRDQLSDDRKSPEAGLTQTPQTGPQPVRAAQEPELVLHQVSEPLDKILRLRRKKLEQMDSLIVEARRRIGDLEGTKDPIRIKERERLKHWIEETLAERDELTTIEKSMTDMESTYRSLLSLQQMELKTKEEAIKSRLDAFHTDIEGIEKEKVTIKEKEEEIERKERELRKIIERIGERENELANLEDKLKERAEKADEQRKKLEDIERQIENSRLQIAQRQLHSQMIALKSRDIFVDTGPQDAGEIASRVSDLEEQIEKLIEERNKIVNERDEMKRLFDDIKKLLKILDELLGQLPPEAIKRFAESGDFGLYEAVLQRCGV